MDIILHDLRDDFLEAFAHEVGLPQGAELADIAIQTINRWVAKEPANDLE